MTTTIASFLFFLLLFLAVGLAAVLRRKNSRIGYYLASRNVSPALAGLSAVATNNSGYMFIGVIGFTYTTGLAAAWAALGSIPEQPDFLNLFPPGEALLVPGGTGIALFITGWMFAGFSVVGQPHIMVRFMALDDPGRLMAARGWYYTYFTLFYAMATGVGLLSRLYLPDLGALDPELALPRMAQQLLPPALVGLVLAGVFAATMSTAVSLILSCSASVTHDLLPERFESNFSIKLATVSVTAPALAIALTVLESVFSLVILAWSVLASAFAPLLFVYAIGFRVSQFQAVAMMVTGVAAALVWRELGWHHAVYEGFPGIMAGVLTFIALRLLPGAAAESVKPRGA